MKNSRMSASSNEFNPREYATYYANERDVMIWKEVFDAGYDDRYLYRFGMIQPT